jgi:hypothetical protein
VRRVKSEKLKIDLQQKQNFFRHVRLASEKKKVLIVRGEIIEFNIGRECDCV